MVGDVDVAVELGRRKPPLGQNGLARDWVEWNIERFEASGRTSGCFLDRICYGDFEVMRLLKSRVASLSLHTLADLNSIGAVTICGNCARNYKIRRIVLAIEL
jgi:hypothetical protein